MFNSGGQSTSSPALVQQVQRLKSFRTLLDPTELLPGHNVADLYSLRHLCLQGGGIPDTASSSSDGWLRAQAWRVLLGYLTPEKSDWNQTLEKRRAEYYQFVRDFLPHDGSSQHQGLPGKVSERDALMDQIYRDLARSRKNAFAFYREEVKSSGSCPLTPPPTHSVRIEPRIESRHSLLSRLEVINADFAHSLKEERIGESSAQGQLPRTPQRKDSEGFSRDFLQTRASPIEAESPAITLQPASPQSLAATTANYSPTTSEDESNFASADEGEHEAGDTDAPSKQSYIDRRWHSLLRILYIYALLNPSTGYVQGMNEVLFVLFYVMGTTGQLPYVQKKEEGNNNKMADGDDSLEDPYRNKEEIEFSFHYLDSPNDPPGSHAEADAFWCFSALIGDIRDLYDFNGMESAGIKMVNQRQEESNSKQITGIVEALKKFSLRLKWLDEDLWNQLRRNHLDPRLPYYSFRWLACMLSTEMTLPSVVRIWDAILAESGGSSMSEGSGSTPKVEFLIDVCCALLTNVRGVLLAALQGGGDSDEVDAEGNDSFGRAMNVLQEYPDDDVGTIIEMACLFRQKRLAAPLTGDGPPSEDEDDSMLSVRERAANALRTWTNSSTPSRTPKWFTASPRTPSFSVQRDVLTPNRSASGSIFQRYTDAIQSSDAAANWSKTSTNLTAKAMATWSGSKSSKESPLAEFRSSLVNRVMSGNSRSPSTDSKQVHPSLRWSVQSMPPELPVPNVNDSPPSRRDSSISSQSPLHGYTNLHHTTGTDDHALRSPDPDSYTSSSTPVTSPTSINFGKTNSRTSKRGGGPKPLLLTGSARPPREASCNGSLSVDEPMSRKVSSGPLAANLGTTIRRKNNGSSSHRDSSHTGSVTSSQADHDSPSIDGLDESSISTKSESLHSLSFVQAATRDWLPPLPSTVSPVGLQGSGHGTGLGTVPASAFAKVRMNANSQEGNKNSLRDITRPSFGQIASSGNVPLATKVTLQRKTNRKDSEISIGLASPIPEFQDRADEISNRDSIESSNSSRRYRLSSSYNQQQSFVNVEQEALHRKEEKYTLTDEPATSTRSAVPHRAESSSSTKSTAGITRRQRAQSSGKRTRKSLVQVPRYEEEGSDDLVRQGGRGPFDIIAQDEEDTEAPELSPPKRINVDQGRLMPAEELLRRLQLDQGYSGGESSGFEDEVLHTSARSRPSHSSLPQEAPIDDFKSNKTGLGISTNRQESSRQDNWRETEDMEAIDNALAYADGMDEP